MSGSSAMVYAMSDEHVGLDRLLLIEVANSGGVSVDTLARRLGVSGPEVDAMVEKLDGELEHVLDIRYPRASGSSDGSHRHPAERLLLAERDGPHCRGCGTHKDALDHTIQVDHVIPRSRGGSNDIANKQLLCKPCNASKGTKTMAEWVAARRRT